MEETIIVSLSPTELQHTIYIMSNNSEVIPIILKTTADELPSKVAMSAAKYNIHKIKLQGAKDYTLGIKTNLEQKINTCFGKQNDFIIELV